MYVVRTSDPLTPPSPKTQHISVHIDDSSFLPKAHGFLYSDGELAGEVIVRLVVRQVETIEAS